MLPNFSTKINSSSAFILAHPKRTYTHTHTHTNGTVGTHTKSKTDSSDLFNRSFKTHTHARTHGRALNRVARSFSVSFPLSLSLSKHHFATATQHCNIVILFRFGILYLLAANRQTTTKNELNILMVKFMHKRTQSTHERGRAHTKQQSLLTSRLACCRRRRRRNF